MDDGDYRAILETLRLRLQSVGATDVARERHYQRRNPETGELTLLPPKEQLLAMLDAFDRFLSIQDRALHDKSVRLISEALEGDAPERFDLLLPSDRAGEPRRFSLAKAPDLEEARLMLRKLRGSIRDDDGEPSSSRGRHGG